MKALLILTYSLAMPPLMAQLPLTRPPTDAHPNTTAPNPDIPPPPNLPDPYDAYGTRNSTPGTAFSDANAAAMHFINIVDNQVYGGAWLDAGSILHDVVPQDVWAAGMRAIRLHLGTVRMRKVSSHQTARALPGGLVGEFMIIKYETQFTYRPNAIETVTLMMHAPIGLWKVICYNVASR